MMQPTTHRSRLRTVAGVVLVVVLAAGAATAGAIAFKKSTTKTAAAAPLLKTTPVTSGDLGTTEKISGTLQLSSSMNILHRIAGQTSSSDTSAPAASGGASSGAGAAQGTGAISNATGAAGASTNAFISRSAATCPTDTGTGSDGTGSGGGGTGSGSGSGKGGGAAPTTVPAPVTTPAPAQAPTDGSTPDTGETTTTTSTTIAPPPDTTPDTTATPPGTTPNTTPVTGPTTTAAPGDTTPDTTASTDPCATSSGRGGSGGGRGGSRSSGGGSGGGSSSTARVTQTITSVIRVGTSVGLGDVLYSVDSQPVVALSGSLPAWRTLSTSATAGPDIQQLEQSLVSLGYDPDKAVTIDDTFDSKTKAMVERWQTGLGIKATGTVTLGSVVFLPTTTTVNSVSTSVGAEVGDGDTIVTLAASTQQVVIDVPDGDQNSIVPGLAVGLGGDATGTVAVLRSVERSGAAVVQAVITPAAPIANASNGATVNVTVTSVALKSVLVVPAVALLSKIDGTYAVQVQAKDGSVSWVTVDLLGISGNKVGIRGPGISAGTLVLVPL